MLGAPAVRPLDVDAGDASRAGARLSVAEVLFGRRVTNRALAALAAVALLIGGVGGLVGRLTAEGGSLLNDPGITLAQVQPSIDRPAGSVAAVAGDAAPAASGEYRVGDQGGFGSGVVIDSHGYLLTNNHVVAIIRRFSVSRQKMEQEEARRLREDKLKDQLEPLRENEVVEWDGLRRRKTVIGSAEFGGPVRRKTIHPPLGMSRFPDQTDNEDAQRQVRESHGFFGRPSRSCS